MEMNNNSNSPRTVTCRTSHLFVMVLATAAAVLLVAVILIATGSAGGAATVTHATTPNPTCGSAYGETVCIQASPGGITFTWTNDIGEIYHYQSTTNSVPPYTSQYPHTEWTSPHTVYVPLPVGEYTGYSTLVGNNPGQNGYVNFDLVVSPSDPPAPASGSGFVAITVDPGVKQGYWLATNRGKVEAFGDAVFLGDLSTTALNKPIVAMAATPDGQGYWLLGADGGVFSFGDAQFYGSTGNIKLNKPAIGMVSTPDGGGYWFVASDGGIFAYGDAQFYGSMGGTPLNKPVVGMALDQATGGYWLVAADGGIFSFKAPFYGSTGSIHLNKPIVGMEAATDGSGYRFVASDGGVFDFNLPFEGSEGGQPLPAPIVSMAPDGVNGYWLLGSNGQVYPFGTATNYGNGS